MTTDSRATQGTRAQVHATETQPRRAGRPRRRELATGADPEDDILRVAARLFQEHGVTGTTMSRLAAEAGLGQSSLYYYFRSRDEVVAALVARANVVPLQLVRDVSRADASEAEKLRRFVQGDVEALCALPFDINEVHRIAARDRTRFQSYWNERSQLARALRRIVEKGVDAGEFRPVDAALTALTIMANDEGVQNWFRLGTKRRPVDVARALAEFTVNGLLAPSD